MIRSWLTKRRQRLAQAERDRRRRTEEEARREALGSPPLSELEVDMRYGAVEAERRKG